MTRAAQIRQWMEQNPGRHFAGDVADGLGVTGVARVRIAQTLWAMGRDGILFVAGTRGYKRYALGRPARKYERQVRA
jgi:hypothetical protein